MTRILIVEDEPLVASFMAKGLTSEGFESTVVGDGISGLGHAISGEFDLMVLDIGIPGIDGLTVLKRLREHHSRLPVIVLTARGSVSDTVRGFDTGADDYMAKPVRFAELVARIRARLRPTAEPDDSGIIEAEGITLNLHTRQVTVDGTTHDLSAREYTFLETFVRHPGQVLSRDQLLSHVWGYDFDPGSNVVDVYVGYLRKKVGQSAITSVRGMGYKLTPRQG